MTNVLAAAKEDAFFYFPKTEFDRIREEIRDPVLRAQTFAAMARFNTLYMITKAGSGHIGSSFSAMDIVAWLHLEEMHAEDVYFSSKGHDVPGLYSVLCALGKLDFDLLHKLRRVDGLPGHPDVETTPEINTNTGALGMGVSKAKGMVFANRLQGKDGRVFVLTGDGELQEGQFWESLLGAVHRGFHEITVVIDHNKIQSDTYVAKTSDLGDLESRLRAHGWVVDRCNGHDIEEFAAVMGRFKRVRGRPQVVIADTVKGSGVSFMEHTSMAADQEFYKFHSGAPSAENYRKAAVELAGQVAALTRQAGIDGVKPMEVIPPAPPVGMNERVRLIPAYTEALLAAAQTKKNLVALDADLILDTGLIPFRDTHPERFFECGIAEQDMVSIASGMALKGLLPVVHSFACFLSTRPNEQIFNAATEKTRIVFVGSLAGLTPAGPGHSHQALRDIALTASVPGMLVVEPSCPEMVKPLLDYCLEQHAGASYVRLVSAPTKIEFPRAAPGKLVKGHGIFLRKGKKVAFVSHGPVLLSEAWKAADLLAQQGVEAAVVDMPWLNAADPAWLETAFAEFEKVIVCENHVHTGGLFDAINRGLRQTSLNAKLSLVQRGVDVVPVSGTNEEAVATHQLDAQSLAALAKA